MNPLKGHEEVYEELEEEVKGEKKKGEKKPPADTVLPSFPPKKIKPVVKTAKAGGYVKAADGCAQRGKTRGRMV